MPYCVKCGEKIPEDAAFCPNCGAPVRLLATRFEIADWGERFVAWIIDMIVVGIFLMPFKWYFTWIRIMGSGIMPGFMRVIPFIDLGFDNIIYFLYWIVMEGIYGQSIGKIIMKLKIVQVNGRRISVPQAIVESLGKAFLLPPDCLIGWLLYSDKKQRLFNHISETIVVKVRR